MKKLLSLLLGLIIFASILGFTYYQKTNLVVKSEISESVLRINLPLSLTERQQEVLALAYDIATKDGHSQPHLLQAILLKETNAGEMKSYKVAGHELGLRPNERYYGLGQIKLSAAKEVIKKYPTLLNDFHFHTRTDEEIISKLIENDKFNITIASKYLLILRSLGYDTVKYLALAYNQGPGGAQNLDADEHPYSRGIVNYVMKLKKAYENKRKEPS